jgi:hypothetical protein
MLLETINSQTKEKYDENTIPKGGEKSGEDYMSEKFLL